MIIGDVFNTDIPIPLSGTHVGNLHQLANDDTPSCEKMRKIRKMQQQLVLHDFLEI